MGCCLGSPFRRRGSGAGPRLVGALRGQRRSGRSGRLRRTVGFAAMQGWVVAGAWLFAVLVALVVLGFAGYELSWKTSRLIADRDRLNRLIGELRGVSADLQGAADRARAVSERRHASAPAEPFLS